MLPEENLEDFEHLKADLEEEHEPSTPTESLLVNDMARHYWLYQRDRSGLGKQNLEVLLSTEVVRAKSGRPHLLAAQVW